MSADGTLDAAPGDRLCQLAYGGRTIYLRCEAPLRLDHREAVLQAEEVLLQAQTLLIGAGARIADIRRAIIGVPAEGLRAAIVALAEDWRRRFFPPGTATIAEGMARPGVLLELVIIAELAPDQPLRTT